MLPEITLIACPNCTSKNIKKAGIKKNLFQTHQKYQCKNCKKTFTLKKEFKNKSYPTNIILNTLSYYNLGHSQTKVQKILSKKHRIKVPQTTISNWINEFKTITAFSRLRNAAKQQYQPENIIEQHDFLHNNLNYKYQLHNFKLQELTKPNKNFAPAFSKSLIKLKEYLEKIPTKQFPHHIFTPNHYLENKSDRASESNFKTLKIKTIKKQNLANKLATLALNLAKNNKQRHKVIQDFMLINDSTTIATEIPIYLTNDDLLYFLSKNFQISPLNFKTPITGHIDLLQIRNNLIHILDYKPNANKIFPLEQLTIYALALASKTKLPLTLFKCAYFDHQNYFEFFPLHVVYKKSKSI